MSLYRAIVLIHNHVIDERQSLPRSFAHIFRRKKRIKDSVANLRRNTRPVISKANLNAVARGSRFDLNPSGAGFAMVTDCFARVGKDVQYHLVDLSTETNQRGQIGIK